CSTVSRTVTVPDPEPLTRPATKPPSSTAAQIAATAGRDTRATLAKRFQVAASLAGASRLAPASGVGDHSVGMRGDRQELVRRAFAALDTGDVEPFRELLDPRAEWVAIPQGGDGGETATCGNRAAIVDRLERHHRNGRRFQLGKLIEAGDRVAVEVT